VDPRLAAHVELAAIPDDEFVDHVYRVLLRRDPEPDAREQRLAKLRERTLSRATLIHELVTGDEFARLRTLDDAVAFAAWARAVDERPRELTAPAGDERPVEIAWTLARYRGEPRVLDVGYAFAEPAYLAALTALGAQELVGVDLAGAEVPGLRAVRADVRELPFDDTEFDVVLCISTVEHVGRDNRVYGLKAERDARALPQALRELRRVGQRVLITVPTGERQELDWLLQLEPDAWLELFRASGFVVFEHEVYERGPDGWRTAPDFSPRGVRFGETSANAVLCAELHAATLRRRAREALRRLARR
jgi:O-antigen chain-terminating methyltransferase